jgi:hypothetical protein
LPNSKVSCLELADLIRVIGVSDRKYTAQNTHTGWDREIVHRRSVTLVALVLFCGTIRLATSRALVYAK